MSIGSHSRTGRAKAQGRGKKGVSTAQRERWQIGTVKSSGAAGGPHSRGSFDQNGPQAANKPAGGIPRGGRAANESNTELATLGAKAASPPPNARVSHATDALHTTDATVAAAAGTEAATNSNSNSHPQPSGFSSAAEVADVQAEMQPFRRQQEAGEPLPEGASRSRAHAQEWQQQQQQQQQQPDNASAFASPQAQNGLQWDMRTESTVSSDSEGGDVPGLWRSFRRPQAADATSSPALSQSELDARRAQSIAQERRGVAAERGRSTRDPNTLRQRIRNVQLDPEAGGLWVDREWVAKEGAALTDELVLGKILGSGFQAHVYELLDRDGRVAPIVLKAARSRALINDTRREWATGQRLSALGPGDAPLPGLMKIGPAVCRGRKRSNHGTKLIGMVLERINGHSVDKVISNPDFHDIHYIRDMLQQVFTALEAAQTAFGFHHYDLRLDNVMEHTPSAEHDANDRVSRSLVGEACMRGGEMTFKVIDYGLGMFDEFYAADEGADSDLDVGPRKKSPWYLLPIRCLGSAPEAIHHRAWRGKGDVYHLLFDLSQKIHGRVWPARDRAYVKRLLSLIQHVTGVQPSATFVSDASPAVASPAPACLPVQCFGVPASQRSGIMKGPRAAWRASIVHRWALQLKAWQWPTNPGLTASEVLTSPFFR